MKKLRVMVTVPLSFRLLSRLYMAFEAFNVGRSGVARSLLGTRFRGSTLEPYVDGFRFRENFFTCFIDAELLQVTAPVLREKCLAVLEPAVYGFDRSPRAKFQKDSLKPRGRA